MADLQILGETSARITQFPHKDFVLCGFVPGRALAINDLFGSKMKFRICACDVVELCAAAGNNTSARTASSSMTSAMGALLLCDCPDDAIVASS